MHEVESVAEPAQLLPPYCGDGLLQLRVRDLEPPPQFLEQLPYPPQLPQLPLIGHRLELHGRVSSQCEHLLPP